jgi:hypothetical protein
MKNFLLLYSGGSGMAPGEAEQKAILAEWGAWFGSLGTSLVDGGSPFMGAKSISTDGHAHDGPVGSMASGYSVIKADTLEAAVAVAQRCPVLKSGAQITVYDPAATPGM